MGDTLLEVSHLAVVRIPFPKTSLACLDGTLHLWKTNSNFVRPDITTQEAHVRGTETGSLSFSVDGNTILTRGGDHTVKRTFRIESWTCHSLHP